MDRSDADSRIDMSSKLEMQRKPVQKLITDECVKLQLVTPKRAKELIDQFAGKPPDVAETEVVDELRLNLHKQVRKIIRKDKGGAWRAPKDQEELRLDIVATKTLRGLIVLMMDILLERDEWLKANKQGLFSRFFS